MSALLLLAGFVALAALVRPLGFADAPDDFGAAAAEMDGGETEPQTGPEPADEAPDESAADGGDGADDDDSPEALVAAAHARLTAPPSAGPQPEAAQFAGQPGPAPTDPAAVFARYQIPPEALRGIPADVQPAVAQFLDSHWQERYRPAAEQLVQDYTRVEQTHAQQQQYFAELQAFSQSEPFQWAQYLHDNPAALDAVRQLLAGGQTGATRPAEVDPEKLDPEARAIYELARRNGESAQAAWEHVRQHDEQLAELRSTLTQYQQQSAAVQQQQREAQAGNLIEALNAEFGRRLGFDLTQRTELKRVWEHVAANAERARQAGTFTDPGRQLRAWFDEGVRLTGLDRVSARRAEQARSATRPPAETRVGTRDPETPEELLAAARAELALR